MECPSARCAPLCIRLMETTQFKLGIMKCAASTSKLMRMVSKSLLRIPLSALASLYPPDEVRAAHLNLFIGWNL
eukprot:1159596-Pelagomonas_calceolata.AAC.8